MGIPVVVVAAGGLPVTVVEHGFGVPMTVADNGRGMPVTFVPSGGLPVVGIASGASIAISSMVILENAGIGTPVGNLSVLEGTGTYTYSITDDPDNKFAIVGSQLRLANSLDYEADQHHPVTIQASNGVDTPITRSIVVSVLNVLEVTLSALTLSAATIAESSPENTAVGTLGAITSGSTLSMTDTASGRFKLSGTNVVAGATATDYEAATSHSITLQQTHPDGNNSPRDTTFVITVTNVVEEPVNSVAPVISGSTGIGSVLSCTTGTWSGSPTSYAYQWKRDGTNIGTGASLYTIAPADVGASITCVVTATNVHGSNSAASNAIVGTDNRPVNSVAPVVSGLTEVFNTLSCTTGTWSNTPTSYAYQWLRNGSDIAGSTTASYFTTAPDVGANVSCRVTAANASGAALVGATSNALLIEEEEEPGLTLDTPILDLHPDSDTGVSSTDNITTDTAPMFTATFPSGLLEGDIIVMRDDGVIVSTHVVTAAEAAGTEPLYLEAADMAVGVHSLTMRQERDILVSEYSAALVVTIEASGAASPEVQQYIDRVVLDPTHIAAVTALIDGIVADGDWATLDGLWIGTTNLTQPSTYLNLREDSGDYDLTVLSNGVPTLNHVADEGWNNGGTIGSLLTHYAVGDGHAQAADMAFGYYCHTSSTVADSSCAFGAATPTYLSLIINQSGDTILDVNDVTFATVPFSTIGNHQGMYVITRTAASGAGCTAAYRNSSPTPIVSGSGAVGTPPAHPLVILAMAGGFLGNELFRQTSDTIGAAFIGKGMNATAAVRISNRINAYMTALGKNKY